MASPFKREFYCNVPGKAAATATTDFTMMPCPYTGTVVDVEYIPDATLTGADTDSATLTLLNKGAAGSGTTSVASKAFVATPATNAPAFVQTPITLSTTAANLSVAAGDVLALSHIKVGNGLLIPTGRLKIVISTAN